MEPLAALLDSEMLSTILIYGPLRLLIFLRICRQISLPRHIMQESKWLESMRAGQKLAWHTSLALQYQTQRVSNIK